MTRFSKQYEIQILPEWKDAFIDYPQLKLDLERIRFHNIVITPVDANTPTFFSSLRDFVTFGCSPQKDRTIIRVHQKLASSAIVGDEYETEVRDCDAAKEFFACLDEQLNKVNQFYRLKEEEFWERGVLLKKQIEIMSELEGVSKEQDMYLVLDTSISSGDESIILPDSEIEDKRGTLESTLTDPENSLDLLKERKVKGNNKLGSISGRSLNCQGKELTMSIPQSMPSWKLSAIGYLLMEGVIAPSSKKCVSRGSKTTINRMDLHRSQKIIRQALIELYKGLGYLNTYRNLNFLVFIKILKKFDKVTGREILPIYLKVVESAHFNSSNKVMDLGDEVEELFIEHFASEDKRKAMKYLNPLQKKESHGKTILIGFFTGCLIALLTGYSTVAHFSGTYQPRADPVYMETVYPILSIFVLLFLHFFLYGCDILAWRKASVNYSFIFELAPTKELKYRDVFLVCTISMVTVLSVLFAHLSLFAEGHSYSQVQSIPGLLLLGFLLVLVCPLNIFYRSSRLCFLRVIKNIVLSPMYKVVMVDFFMADQLCSQVPMLRNLAYISCYYAAGRYKNQDNGYCMRTKFYRDLAYSMSFLPYYWRAMQCARKWFDNGKRSNLVNLGKYVSAMLAAGAKVAYEKQQSTRWLCLVVVLSSTTTIYQLYWDYVKDWGLLQPSSRNPWLRNKLMLRQKTTY